MTGRAAVAGTRPAGWERTGRAPAPPAPARSARGWRVLGEVVAATVVAVLVAVAVLAVVARLPIPSGSNVGLALTASGGLLVAGVLAAAGLLYRRRPALTAPLAWVGLSALSAVPLSLLLASTRHYLFGVSGDQAFRVQYLTRFADSARPADVAYADLPPFYPQAWFWVGGRLADLFGVEAWAFYKPFAVTTMAVTGVLAFVLWSVVVGRVRALGLATATTLVGLALAAYTPYSWLTAALVAPVAVLGVRLVDPTRVAGRPWVGAAVTTGLILGVAGVTHTQICAFLVLVLVVATADGALRGRSQGGPYALHLLRTAAVVVVAALPLLLLNWTPYLLARLRLYGSGTADAAGDAAQRFLPQSGATYPLPMLEPTVLGALALAGTVWIVLRFGRDPVARGLGWTVVCGYAWYLLSTLALVADTTLLSFRIEPIISTALACGAVGLAADGMRAVRSRLGGSVPDGARTAAARLPLLVAALAAAIVVGQVQTTPETYSWSTSAQNGDYYPDGTKPTGARAETDAGAWNDRLASTIDELTGRPANQVVVLSNTYALLSYHPYRAYQTTVAQYANPLADFAGRRDRLLEWSRSGSPAELLARLDAGPVRAPSVFVLSRGPDGLLRQGLTYDPFPSQATGSGTAVFEPRLFDDPAFVRRDVGPFTVVVRPDVPPVR
ncbi:arabinofuranosyltransferase [Pseudonocardia sp. KRD291]|uniref:arabinofuranosyltransferase n=1 Tax=Pseudonocardia sp. KRD291 TaxID=2792007 RepID=UPI001C49EBEB|nr:arabinofuranosyltransferase [Pseudonocardia sp. KRD291]MBW0104474.1 arabinofuranosyltransferase [Pseudonocardia sp. KRD291]